MAYYDEKLKDLYQQKAQKKRLEAMKVELKQQEELVAKKTAELDVIKQKEQLDVDKLEGKTLKALFVSIAGTKEEKLSKERQEAYAAAMKYEAAQRELLGIMEDIKDCEAQLETLANIEGEYETLLEQKKAAVKSEGSPKAEAVLQMEKDLTVVSNEITELEEALDAGYKTFGVAEKVVTELEKAKELADWDTFMDSFLIDMQKQEHIQTAQNLIGELQTNLRRFKTELADVEIQGDIRIEMDDFSKFADWFFDNIFLDLDIQAKIQNSLMQATETRTQITETIQVLKDRRDACAIERSELQEKLENTIVGA